MIESQKSIFYGAPPLAALEDDHNVMDDMDAGGGKEEMGKPGLKKKTRANGSMAPCCLMVQISKKRSKLIENYLINKNNCSQYSNRK